MPIQLRVGAPILVRQRKLVTTFGALGHAALDNRWTSRTRECSTIRYVKCEVTFGTFNYALLSSHGGTLLLRFCRKSFIRFIKTLSLIRILERKALNSLHRLTMPLDAGSRKSITTLGWKEHASRFKDCAG